ncbi:MAG: cytochrome C biogenesis protein [Pseudonocardiaceae bacterium]|nr:cytochrome C biogenesis protein [Pseudonocardiaceae bacterium]
MELFALMSLALVAGIVSFSSPCVLPLLPGYVSYVSGLSRLEPGREQSATARRRVAVAAVLFVLGFSVVFTMLGATASALGALLTRHQRALELLGGAVIIAMGLTMAGLLRIRFLQRPLRFDLGRLGHGPAGAVPLGAAFAFGWTPCVGPVLASILATAAGTSTLTRGALLLFVYSLGLGIPFLLLAAGLARGRSRFGWLRRHGRRIEIAGGVVLATMGVAFVTGMWTTFMSGILATFARLGWPPL